MQEGQVYEALMTMAHRRLTNITAIVDINGFQSDNNVGSIMPIHDLAGVIGAFGLRTISIDGHDPDDIVRAIGEAAGIHQPQDQPCVVLATTVKAGGTEHMKPSVHPVTKLAWQPWHTKVPNWDLYVKVVEEQLEVAGQALAQSAWIDHLNTSRLGDPTFRANLRNSHRPPAPPGVLGTGKAFGGRLCEARAVWGRGGRRGPCHQLRPCHLVRAEPRRGARALPRAWGRRTGRVQLCRRAFPRGAAPGAAAHPCHVHLFQLSQALLSKYS